MSVSLRSIAEIMDPIESANSIKSLASMSRWPTGEPTYPLSLRAILNRHQHPQKIQQRFLFYNTFLLHFRPFHKKPAIEARALEIGEELRQNFDIASLCEVFDRDDQKLILEAWSENQSPYEAGGPGGGLTELPSGLFSISTHYPFTPIVNEPYSKDGNEFSDSDAHANKGILLTEIDLGFPRGKLEIYSTHLFSGSSTPIRLAQATQLVSFFERNHKAENVALIVGDFNINFFDDTVVKFNEHYAPLVSTPLWDEYMDKFGINSTPYDHLIRLLGKIDMDDLWEIRNRMLGLTSDMVKETSKELAPALDVLNRINSYIDRLDMGTFPNPIVSGLENIEAWSSVSGVLQDVEILIDRFKGDIRYRTNAPQFEQLRIELIEAVNQIPVENIIKEKICWVDNRNKLYCDDLKQEEPKGTRLDYIFVERKKPEHGFILDFTRPRRVRFERKENAYKRLKIAYLSDHLGLATTLIATPL